MGTFIDSTGAHRRTYAEIKADREADFRAALGNGVDLNSSGYTGQIVALLSRGLSEVWELFQQTFDSRNVNNAQGVPLDFLLSLIGMDRLPAGPTQANVVCYADGAHLPLTIVSGKQVERVAGSLLFSLDSDLVISSASCRDIYLAYPTATAGNTYSLALSDIGVVSFTVPALSTAPEMDLLNGIANLINLSLWAGTATVYDTSSPRDSSIQFGGRCLVLRHPTSDFSIPSTDWTIQICGSNGIFDCVVDGPNDISIGDLNSIYTPVANWLSCYNLAEGETGRNIETDEEARIRRKVSFRTGKSTEEAIYRWIMNYVPGVSYCNVISNRNDFIDADERAPHSFEVVVQGGKDADVAKAIWNTAPAGIRIGLPPTTTFTGNTHIVVTDYAGNPQDVYFSRPQSQYLWVKISYSLYSQEIFPSDGFAQISADIVAWAAKEFSLGVDVIPSRFLQAVYQVPGLGPCTVTCGVTSSPSTPPTSYGAGVISIAGRYRVALSAAQISYELAP